MKLFFSTTAPLLRARHAERGSILLTVLVVIVILTFTSMAYYDWSFSEYKSSVTSERQQQTNLAAESGIEYLRYFVSQDEAWLASEGGLSNNPSRMQTTLTDAKGQLPSQAALRCRFSIVSPAMDASGEFAGFRWGLENESARLNLNSLLVADARDPSAALGRQLLLTLPGMTDSIADAILDWIDTDNETREFGAERNYYSGLDTPYEPQNGPLESLDQLLMVRDITPQMLYGLDRNRNFVVDDAEALAFAYSNVDNSTGSINRGWIAYLTLHSAEKNLRADGTPKIDINNDDLEALRDELTGVLDDDQVNFILAFRQGGAYEEEIAEAEGGETLKPAGGILLDFEQGGAVPISSLLDLVGVRTRVVEKGQTERTIVETPFPDEPGAMGLFLPVLLENLTVNSQKTIPGRININQAPRLLLDGLSQALPDVFPPELVGQILGNRAFEPRVDRPEQAYETWILTQGYVTLDQMKQIMPLITSGGNLYRAQVVGYYEAEGPQCRLEVVIDATSTPPKIVVLRDFTPLGTGFSPEQLGISE